MAAPMSKKRKRQFQDENLDTAEKSYSSSDLSIVNKRKLNQDNTTMVIQVIHPFFTWPDPKNSDVFIFIVFILIVYSNY